jgi:hypothetical protein
MGGTQTGGTQTGGTQTGGTQTGGTQTGGTQTGGTQTGGTQTGGTQTGGTQMGGTQMGGTQMGGTQMGGTQMGGTQMGGTQMGGTQMGGEMYPPLEMGDPCLQRQPDLLLPCSISIYEMKTPNHVPEDRLVEVEGVLTAKRFGDDGLSHWVIQTSTQDPVYRGVEYSATWLYLNDALEGVDLEVANIGDSL